MSILDLGGIDVNDSFEPKAMDADSEVEVQIVDVKMETDKNGEPYLLPRFEVIDEPTAKEFTKFLRVPHKGLAEKKLNSAKRTLANFGAAFDVDFSGKFDIEELRGLTGWVIVGIDGEEGDEYGEQNYVKRFVAPK